MELIEEKNKDKDEIGAEDLAVDGKCPVEAIAKVTVTKRAEALTSELVGRVNDGFEFGRVSRHQLISWILTKFSESCSDQEIRAIRADHFDEMALLELSIKRFRQAGALPPELKRLLLAQAGADETTRKPAKRAIDTKVNH